jgi:uncharacterized membrane protein
MHVQTALRFSLLLWIGSLFALLGLQRFLLDPLDSLLASAVVFIIQVAPLLLLTPLALRPGARGPLWIALVLPLYLMHGIWQLDARPVGMLEVIFALGAFVTAWLLLRVLPREDPMPRL